MYTLVTMFQLIHPPQKNNSYMLSMPMFTYVARHLRVAIWLQTKSSDNTNKRTLFALMCLSR